jgi:predicted RNA binding protein YcfA (HicA-like mRNA interferase family)
MTRLPVVSGQRLIKLLRLLGFNVVRMDGSHHFLRHDDGRFTTVPVHRNVDLTRPLLRTILRQAGISIEDYLNALNND